MSGSDVPQDIPGEAFMARARMERGLSPVAQSIQVAGFTASGNRAVSLGTRSGRQDWSSSRKQPVTYSPKSSPEGAGWVQPRGLPDFSPLAKVSSAIPDAAGDETIVPSKNFSPPRLRRGSSGANVSVADKYSGKTSLDDMAALLSPPSVHQPVSCADNASSGVELDDVSKNLFHVAQFGTGGAPLPSCVSSVAPLSFEASPHLSQQYCPDSLVVSTAGSVLPARNSCPPTQMPSDSLQSGTRAPLPLVRSTLNPKRQRTFEYMDGTLQEVVVPPVSTPEIRGTPLETYTFGNSTMTASARRDAIHEQRTTNGLWLGSWAFPGQDFHGGYDGLHSSSCTQCTKFMCHEIRGCSEGDCCTSLESVHVYKIRSSHNDMLAGIGREKESCQAHAGRVLEQLILPFYDRQTAKWCRIPLEISPGVQLDVCVASYALILGYSGSSAYTAIHAVEQEQVKPCETVVRLVSGPKKGAVQLKLVDAMLITQYIIKQQLQGECQPVPGAHRRKLTVVNKKTMRKK